MIERIIENWLIKADERSFQFALCSVLIEEGHTIIHVSRHSPMEMGKDILTIGPDGIPCAFQIKSLDGKKLNLTKYREDVEPQLNSLSIGKIVHPAIDSNIPHIPYLVLNGELEEEVSRSIDDFNRGLEDAGRGVSKVRVLVKGNLYQKFIALQEKLWTNNLVDVRNFLEIYSQDGKGYLPKKIFSELIYSSLPFDAEKLSKKNYVRAILSTAIIVASSITEYTRQNNFNAEFEAWVIYLAHCFALAEKNNFSLRDIENEIELPKLALYNSLLGLCEEVKKTPKLEALFEINNSPLFGVKITNLLSKMSILGLWEKFDNRENADFEFIKKFCRENINRFDFWGEAAIPQFLACYFFGGNYDGTAKFEYTLKMLIETIIKLNGFRSEGLIPNPYYDVDEALPFILRLDKNAINDSFSGSSYTLETLLHLYVKRNWKQTIKSMWHNITKMTFRYFKPNELWQTYLWRNKEGMNVTQLIKPTQKWDDLKNTAFDSVGQEVPPLIKNFPILYLCFLIVYPQRINSSGVRWLDSILRFI